MPALPVVANVIRINLSQVDITSLPLGNRLFWHYTGGAPSSADCVTLAGLIRAAADTNFTPMLASGDITTNVEVTDLSSVSGGQGISTGSSTSTRSGGALPIGSAAVCSHVIARRYRGGKPRTYFQWGTDTDLNGQANWSSAFLTAANSAYAAFAAALNGATGGTTVLDHQVNCSFYHGFTVVTSPTTGRARNVPTPRTSVTPDTVTSSAFASKLGSQRRRYGR